MLTTPIFWLTADVVSSSRLFIFFNVLMLKVTMLTILLHLSKLGFSSAADFLNTGESFNLSRTHPLFTYVKSNAIWMYGLN